MKPASTPLAGMFMFQQRERADTLENIVAAAILGVSVMDCRTRDGAFPRSRSLVKATGKELGQRRVGTDRQQTIIEFSQARPLQWLTLLHCNRCFVGFHALGVPRKQPTKTFIASRVGCIKQKRIGPKADFRPKNRLNSGSLRRLNEFDDTMQIPGIRHRDSGQFVLLCEFNNRGGGQR